MREAENLLSLTLSAYSATMFIIYSIFSPTYSYCKTSRFNWVNELKGATCARGGGSLLILG